LVVELNQPNISLANIAIVKKNVEALIGFFNLDPNRVLDLMLDSFMNNLWNREPYLSLLREMKGDYVAQVLGFKFQHYLAAMQTAIKAKGSGDLEEKIPKKLCLLTAILVSNKVIQIEDIWPHLGTEVAKEPDCDEVETLLKRQMRQAQYQYKSLFESVMNKEAHETALKQKITEQD
jgi:THO complex subunit 2 N-terminus